MTREEKCRLLGWLIPLGTGASALFHFYHHPTFLFYPRERFHDFTDLFWLMKDHGSPYDTPAGIYFPFAFLPIKVLTYFDETTALVLFTAAVMAFTLMLIFRYLEFLSLPSRIWMTFCLSIFSYPFLFLLDRGNFEGLLFIFLSFGIIALENQYERTGAFFISCAAGMKAYPALFLCLIAKNWDKKKATGN